jgi:hypothetical protein
MEKVEAMKSSSALLVLGLLIGSTSFGAAKNENTLTFESDLIEGERRQPELFIDAVPKEMTLDALLYRRNNFNDFHRIDRKFRPRLLPAKANHK